MEIVRMVVGVITMEERGVTKVLTVYRNPTTKRCFGGRIFLPGCVIQSEEAKGEIELLANEFSDKFGVQFGLETKEKGWGDIVYCRLDGTTYNIVPLRGRLSSNKFKEASGVAKYDLTRWVPLSNIRTFKTGDIMADCLKQFGLL